MAENTSKFEKELESITQIQESYDDGFSVQEVVQYYLDRIDVLNKKRS